MDPEPSFFEKIGCFSREKHSKEPTIAMKNHTFDRKNSVFEPFSATFFVNLLDLEDKFFKNENSIKLINDLSVLYAVLKYYMYFGVFFGFAHWFKKK